MKKLYLKQKVFTLKDRYQVFDENQKPVYVCEGKLFSLSRQVDIYNMETNALLFTIKRKIFSIMPQYRLMDVNGIEVATMKKQLSFTKHKMHIESIHGTFVIEGNLWAHNFTISDNQRIVVTVSKKVISWGDTYEISIEDNVDETFMVALVIMIDSTLHNRKKRGR